MIGNEIQEENNKVLAKGAVMAIRNSTEEAAILYLLKRDKINEIYTKISVLAEVIEHGSDLGYKAYIHDLERELSDITGKDKIVISTLFLE